jgi:cell division protein DivIC
MKKFSVAFDVLKNKYIFSILAFIVWVMFFDRNDIFTQWDRKSELQKLEESRQYYLTEITTIKKDLEELQNNTSVLEKFARENFYLKRPNQDVFIVEEDVNEKK